MSYQPTPLRVLSLNCRGLNVPERRSHLLRDLRKAQISVAMLQETHFLEGSAPKLRNQHYPHNSFNNHPTSRRSGVAILLAAEMDFRVLDRMSDTQGRFLFLKGTIADKLYTLVSVYVPNTNQARFLRGTLNKLRGFSEGALIVGGDFNAPLDSRLDASNGRSCLPLKHTIHT
ncbi:Hypothetical predicted protein [Pelobates cultripes]|uniref:exodeoxyribonuclease III n=1 Tax=Pelobates cultripes TaxID=61616 RepID=A0AAD1SRZ4_PELCU|nr:Hypothetical predicted protein [Pelobates cultripes]